MNKLYPSDFNVFESNPNGVLIRLNEINDMIDCGALQVDEDKLEDYYNNTRVITPKRMDDNKMSETVKLWIENFENNDTSVEEEITEVKGAILNELIWADGVNRRNREQHFNHVEELKEYLEWLEEKK